MSQFKPSAEFFTQADGRQLAFNMFRELEAWAEQVEFREIEKNNQADDMPDMRELMLSEEPEILRRYLSTIAHSHNPDLERGFLSVLNQALISCVDVSWSDELAAEYTTPRPGLRWESKS